MAQASALSSDHINYLILRYLQESGHETSARAFYKDWHRPREYRDPEDLSFAPSVRRLELVSVIQDGLAHDELHARVGRNERRFRWILEASGEDVEDDGESRSRPPSSGKRKGRVPALSDMRAPDEFPTPAAKRQRTNPEPETVHVNGDRDAMDVDAASASVGEADEDAEAASPEAASDDATEAPERYDSLDVATQTEIRRGPKTSTVSFHVSKPTAKVFNSSWSPSKDPGEASTLFAVGEDLCRYYQVPELDDGDLKTIQHLDEPSLPPGSIITASAWHPYGHMATCAVDSPRELPGGKQGSSQTLVDIGRDIGTVTYPSALPSLDPPGIVLCIRYSPSGEHILVLRTNLKRGLVQIYDTPTSPDKLTVRKEQVAWRIFEHQVFDATWTSDNSFVVCGDHGITKSYKITEPEQPATNGFTPATLAVHNLAEQSLEIAPGPIKWDKVRHDANTGLLVFASAAERKLVAYLGPNAAAGNASQTMDIEIPESLSALELRPQEKSAQDISNIEKSILAASFGDGTTLLYGLSQTPSFSGFERITALELGQSPALALSWSPDGRHLAVGGSDIVRIWRVDNIDRGPVDMRPLVTWRQPIEINGSNGEHQAGDEALVEPSLSWTADGERLGFSVERQVCSFRCARHVKLQMLIPTLGRRYLFSAASVQQQRKSA